MACAMTAKSSIFQNSSDLFFGSAFMRYIKSIHYSATGISQFTDRWN